jgi:hypothetical protein
VGTPFNHLEVGGINVPRYDIAIDVIAIAVVSGSTVTVTANRQFRPILANRGAHLILEVRVDNVFAHVIVRQVGMPQAFGELAPRFGLDLVRFAQIQTPDMSSFQHFQELQYLAISHTGIVILVFVGNSV